MVELMVKVSDCDSRFGQMVLPSGPTDKHANLYKDLKLNWKFNASRKIGVLWTWLGIQNEEARRKK